MNESNQTGEAQWPTRYDWLPLFALMLVVLLFNVFLILLIAFSKSLRSNNTVKIIVSLSITDIALSLSVMPFSIYARFYTWRLGDSWCLVWLATDIQLTTTSIYHLCAIAYERHLSVSQPIKYRLSMRRRILTLIGISWLLSFGLVTLPFLVSTIRTEHTPGCGLRARWFIAYSTLVTFWIPLAFMVVFALRTIVLIRRFSRSHRNFNLGTFSERGSKHSSIGDDRVYERTNMELQTRKFSSFSAHVPASKKTANYLSVKLNSRLFRKTLSTNTFSGNIPEIRVTSVSSADAELSAPAARSKSSNDLSDESFYSAAAATVVITRAENLTPSAESSAATRPIRRLSSFSKLPRMSDLRKSIVAGIMAPSKEIQAQKSLSAVLIVFILCYLPLFIYITYKACSGLLQDEPVQLQFQYATDEAPTNINNPVYMPDGATSVDYKFFWLTWLGYASAAMNPFLHLSLNNNFRKALSDLLRPDAP
nr:G protein-coupled receptor [Proales similis]